MAMTGPEPAPRIAVLIPCYNEEISIAKTVIGFRAALPTATVYVYENNSKDQTSARALEAGAVVRSEKLQGKGNVVRRMFSDIEADVYVMVDGDATYDPEPAQEMVKLLLRGNLDMVVGKRVHADSMAYRSGHVLDNRLLTAFLGNLFGQSFSDILSGYRAFSRRFVKSFPALSTGFETETELSVHALTLKMPIAEVQTNYLARAAGSASKLDTYRDGWRILFVMLGLFKNERPTAFFGGRSCTESVIFDAFDSDLRHLFGDGIGAAIPDRNSIGIHDAARVPESRVRLRARHGLPWTA